MGTLEAIVYVIALVAWLFSIAHDSWHAREDD